MVVTSKEFWDSLPKDLRGEVDAALSQAIVFGNNITAKKAQQDKQKIIDLNRSTIIILSFFSTVITGH
jgi:C4-dicarboxylate-binding protein DctP